MFPLSFKEFLSFNNYDESNLEEKFNEYLKYGGLPAIKLIKGNDELILSYLSDIYNTIVKKDIIDRNNIKEVSLLEKSYIIYKADRTDVKSKALLKTLGKYYVFDSGLRNIILGFRNINEGHLLENIVYLELLRRGYRFNIGKYGEYEVDFVALKSSYNKILSRNNDYNGIKVKNIINWLLEDEK